MQPTDQGILNCVATDGHRLSWARVEQDWSVFGPQILPTEASKHLIAMIAKAGAEDLVSVEQVGLRFRFTFGSTVLTCKTIDGTFPDYTRVVPKMKENPEIWIPVNGAAFKRLPLFYGESRAVKFDAANKAMSVNSYDSGYFAMPLSGGRGDVFGLNLRYLRAFVPSGVVATIVGTGRGDPLMIVTDDESLTRVIMPMKV